MDYMLRRWNLFARFLDDGRICLTNNAAERASQTFRKVGPPCHSVQAGSASQAPGGRPRGPIQRLATWLRFQENRPRTRCARR